MKIDANLKKRNNIITHELPMTRTQRYVSEVWKMQGRLAASLSHTRKPAVYFVRKA